MVEGMSGERPLPDCRLCTTHRVKIGSCKIYLTVGFYDEDKTQVGEVFIALEKTGAERRWMMDEIARLASKLLQRGHPLEEIGDMWLGTKAELGGPVQGDDRIKNCTSVLDYVARHLLVYYCGREELAHVKI
jgi:ribonucleoside-diphosphate reductase alpha chain